MRARAIFQQIYRLNGRQGGDGCARRAGGDWELPEWRGLEEIKESPNPVPTHPIRGEARSGPRVQGHSTLPRSPIVGRSG